MNFIGFFLVITLVSSAEIHRVRRNGRHHHNHKSSTEQAHSTTEKSQFEPALQHEEYRGEMPPHIWALLAANSLAARNNQTNDRSNDDGTKYNEIDIDSDFDRHTPVDDEAEKREAANCPKCKQNNNVKMSEDELTNLRIEYVKNEILNKLRMYERPPKKEILDELPVPIQEGHTMEGVEDENADSINNNLNVEDYFAKTTQKIIFLTQGKFILKKIIFVFIVA